MKGSLVLSTAVDLLHPLLLLFSIYLLFRGHNSPGGGFVGGLVAAAGFALYALAHGPARARVLLHVHPRSILGAGLAAALSSGMVSLLRGEPFMTGIWTAVEVPVMDKVGTPLLFDAGVFLVVLGVTLLIILSLMEE
jgi:multicomponent Na+:H+ antiporter subunit B